MSIKGKYESKLQNIALSCDAFTTGYLVMCLLFFSPYVAANGGALVAWFIPVACIVPFVAMPLIYMLVHRVDTLLFGRYHFVMPVSAFVSSLFMVLAWSASARGAGDACLIFFGALVFAVATSAYRYCAFSVRARLGGRDFAPRYASAFSAFGAVAAIATVFGFLYYDQATAFLNTAYVIGGAGVALALVQYLTTYYGIPRLCGKRTQSVKNVFRMFYAGLDKRMYFSSLLFTAAFATIAALVVFFGIALGFGLYEAAGCAVALAACYAAGEYVCSRIVKRRRMCLSVISLLLYVAAAGLLIAVAAVDFGERGALIAVAAASGLTGVGGAVTVRQTDMRFASIKPHVTGGVVFILKELTAFASAAIAFVASAAVTEAITETRSITAFVYGFAASAVFALSAFAVAGKKTSTRSRIPDCSYELDAESERSHAAQADRSSDSDGDHNLSNGALSASDKE